ncbi:hypothetical protein NWFMUON74_64050 [Nocardia wallacei]|uniref:Uncharacterized protein n=1 Tax=Nocardia wallacei TaxID=480035 RepID=A0A7G1KWT4_9NOCA|nr:hypothetical protein NWFMUON74_64050 [Nocardia wallacei]
MTNAQVPDSNPGPDNRIRSDVHYVALPGLCRFPEIELAHELMQRHRACRIGRCVEGGGTAALAAVVGPEIRS